MVMKNVRAQAIGIAPPCLGEALIIEEACRLADTGRYVDYTDIEHVMRFGYALASARAVLERYPVRRMLNSRCADAREQLASRSSDPCGEVVETTR